MDESQDQFVIAWMGLWVLRSIDLPSRRDGFEETKN